MSSRQLRKIRQQQELLKAADPAEGTLASTLGGDDSEDENNDDDDDNDEKDGNDGDAKPHGERSEPAPASTAPKRNKKKKKKGKKKQGGDKATETPHGADEDEIDRALKELNIKPRAQGGSAGPSSGGDAYAHEGLRQAHVLEIDPYNLKAVHEMKNLFGREGKDYWPRATAGGLVMKEMAVDPEGVWTEYAFVHEKQYDVIQTIFFHCVGLGDPMRMVYLLKQFPYHISTLLQVSSFAKQDQNQALAADLCERALFTFGRATLSTFRTNLERGRARLNFKRPENRQFWLAGYHYLKSLMRKGTYRTALEWAKLIFSLDPGDPYGMNHLIHVLAIKSHQSEWLRSLASGTGRCKGKRGAGRGDGGDALALLCLVPVVEPRRTPSIWGAQPPSEVDAFYTKLYLELTRDLWNYPRSTSLLNDAAKAAKKQEVLKATDAVLDLRTARFVYLEGNTTMLGLVPRHYLERQPNYEFDPSRPTSQPTSSPRTG
ncbi:unnamed protein product [Parascedosporium putredinis]|uniref:DUF654-domain-containing protein n=1 Tax=Parascedosporium putredinis TaxID=1442378 RepID=A0A9P1MCH3_9PEZI|nr:unnamed protein product [Parascedosporium putredinis]CAI8001557.1 unnamed protein product [Parascedosporium putredinis]